MVQERGGELNTCLFQIGPYKFYRCKTFVSDQVILNSGLSSTACSDDSDEHSRNRLRNTQQQCSGQF